MAHINKKASFIRTKLSPLLNKSSLSYCKDIWEVFVCPLFEFTLPIYVSEPVVTRRLELERLVRRTFKKFTGIIKLASRDTVTRLCGYNIRTRGRKMIEEERLKWVARKRRVMDDDQKYPQTPKRKVQLASKENRNYYQEISRNSIELVNLLAGLPLNAKTKP